jgi:hypothetical protein
MMSQRIACGASQLLLPKIPAPAFRGCPDPEGVIFSILRIMGRNLCQYTRSRIVILSRVPCGLRELKFGKDSETEVGSTTSD